LRREEIFARDGYRCVYCGQVFPADQLSVDHVQARMRGGDRSGGNLVTACGGCNVLKGHRRLAEFLADDPAARANFFRHAVHVWPRHLRAVEEEVRRESRRRESGR
jgi:5-methylcytosine-specific restriction endonuclease McrA